MFFCFSKLLLFVPAPHSHLLGSTDRSRPPLTVLSRAILAPASTEGLKRWTVKWCPFLHQGHVFCWNAFSGSTHDWVSPLPPRRRRPPAPSIVVAHTDSVIDSPCSSTSSSSLPPPSSDFAQLSKQTSLLSSQAGRQGEPWLAVDWQFLQLCWGP